LVYYIYWFLCSTILAPLEWILLDHGGWYFWSVLRVGLWVFYWVFWHQCSWRKLVWNSLSLLNLCVVWVSGDCDLIKWIWQCSLCFYFVE
jgi:hypothetical protein